MHTNKLSSFIAKTFHYYLIVFSTDEGTPIWEVSEFSDVSVCVCVCVCVCVYPCSVAVFLLKINKLASKYNFCIGCTEKEGGGYHFLFINFTTASYYN